MTEDFAIRMMKKLGWQEGKGLGKEEDGVVRPVQVDQKQNVKGIGYGTEGAFEPWWDDLYTKTAIGTKIKRSKKHRELKESKKDLKSKKSKDSKKDKKHKKSKESKEKRKSKKDNLDKI